jgi:hypothetical protein
MANYLEVDQHQMGATQDPLTEWQNEPSVMMLSEDLSIARPWHDTFVTNVGDWLDARNVSGRYKPKTLKNRSSVQPKLIRKNAEWRYSALSEPFLSSEKMFDVSPVTWEDKESAIQNELVLNYQFRNKLNPVKFIDSYVRTVTDEGTCIIRTGWKRETETVMVEVPVWTYVAAQFEDEMAMLEEAMALSTENPQGFSELPEEIQESARYTMETKQPVIAFQSGTEMVPEERVVKNHPTVDILNYNNVYIDPSCEGDIDKANFVIVSFETSKAKLKKDGRYKNLDKVIWSTGTPGYDSDHASSIDESQQFKDELRKVVVAYEYWGWYDVEGNGELKPIVATWIGHTMIRMEENPFPDKKLPFVVVPYLPVKDSVTGEPDAALLKENQAILGAVTRGVIDLMGRSANGQTGFSKGSLDVLNKRRYEKGEDYEFNPGTDPRMNIFQHTYPEIPGSALNVISMQNQEAEALTGVKAFSGGLSGEAYGQVAAGIRGILDASSKREMSILRRLAQGMEEIGRKIISMNGAFLSEEEVIQVTNEKFVKISREDLLGEFNLKVDIATTEVDEAKAQDLGFMLQTLGNTVPFEITKNILMEIARLKRMPRLVHMIEQFQPQPDPLEEKKKELEIAMLELELSEIQSKIALNQAKTQETLADARKTSSEADLNDLDFIEQETGTKHARDMDKQGAQAEANQQTEIIKGILNPKEGSGKNQVAEAVGYQNFASRLTP